MQLDNNFRFKHDPFGLMDFGIQDVIILPNEQKNTTRKSKWMRFAYILLLVSLIIVFCKYIYTYFKTKYIPDISTEPTIEQLKIPDGKIIKTLPLSEQGEWDNTYLEAKKAEGKAYFVTNQGWYIYE